MSPTSTYGDVVPMRSWAKITLPIVACIASAIGCENRASVEECGDIYVRDNLITPYGICITDCERAEEVARQVAKGRDIAVYADDCALIGSGEAARYICAGGTTPPTGNVVGPGGRPPRDDAYRIAGLIWVRGDDIDYQQALVDAGAAEVCSASSSARAPAP
jgi:hypothetical protein